MALMIPRHVYLQVLYMELSEQLPDSYVARITLDVGSECHRFKSKIPHRA
ncbi:hypothetical protein MGG_15726 [Pyricularia oryzae 70-15]|uniref:Uncharacterized protein n=1 Tax=Pyricularia oryzae (strain 70-15 / ATCC MYA-4617 / FGSC 8958) TaxID=242507 RepID=G4MT26_PYRO7|nr:uncharacterized protein MGG_15726 [Pyricularia oryzae 70-15]EHA54685.1 hypothetical protein MGG_15726 [Pyricularia oryzae 70-15]